MAGLVTVYLRPPLSGGRKEHIENVESMVHTGTGDYIVERPEASRRIFPDHKVRSVKAEKSVRFIDQS